MLKGGFVGFGAGGAGALGAGSATGALGAGLVGPTAATTGLLGGGGAFLSGGSLLTGSSLVPGSTATAASTLIPASVKGKVGVVSASVGGTTGAAVPFSATTFGGVGGLIPTTTAVSAGGAALGTPAASAAISTAVKSGAAKSASSGFLGKVGNFIKDGVVKGAQSALATVTTNTLLYGDPLGDTDGPDPLYRTGEGGRSFFGDDYSQLRSMVKPFPTLGDLGTDAVGSTYVTLLSNLNYGTGSRNYALNSNMALMKGIQVPQVQYA